MASPSSYTAAAGRAASLARSAGHGAELIEVDPLESGGRRAAIPSDPRGRLDRAQLDHCTLAAGVPVQRDDVGSDEVEAPTERKRLGRFALTRLLGRGGMGEVWAALDPELDREVAIKLLYVDFGGMDRERQARLRREAQAMARVNHPNIVQIYELGADGDRLFCAMELIDGETLRQWLETPRPWRETLDVLLAAGRGVAAAHAAGLVHRDVKPDNVMIARDGRIVVADFGLARLTEMGAEPAPAETSSIDLDARANALLTTRTLLGTPVYMAPEVLSARGGDAQSDQFSFCVMACEALYGSRPFRGTTLGELMASVHEEPAPPRPGRRPPPRGIWRRLRRGLAVAVEQRWPTMEPLLAGLERAAVAPRRRRVAIAAAAVVALAVSSVVALAPPERDEEELAREAGESRIAAVWSPARLDGMRTAFARAGQPPGAVQAASTTGALDRYRDAWLAMRMDAWRATNRREEQSARLLELRMRCLDRLADEMDAFLQVAAEADQPDELRRIAQGVGRLTPVATCIDEGSMAAVFPSTIDDDRPDLRVKFDVEEARMRAAIAAMPPAEAMKAINAAIAEADRARVPGLSSGLLFLLAVTQNEVNDVRGAEATLRRMIQEAARARRHFMVAAGWLRIMRSLTSRQRRLEEALALEPIARAAVAQAGDEPALRAELAQTMAAIAWEKKDLTGARDHYLAARDIMIAARGPTNEVAAGIEANAAEALFWVGDLDEARRLAEHAYSILRHYPAEDRPAANALIVQAWVARERKDWESVVRHSRGAVAQLARLHGTDNLDLAMARRELGLALGQLGRHDEAIEQVAQCAESLRRLDAAHPDAVPVALEVGALHEKAGRTLDAERNNRRAVELARGQGKQARPQLGRALLELARMVAHRAPSEAIPIYDEGMRIVAALPDVEVEEHVEALREMSNAALATGRARWMLTWFDRLPGAAARLPALRRRLVAAARRQ
jgi:tetratricopeptide (TPR) repeat protein